MDMLHSECQLGGSCRVGRWNGQSGRIRHGSRLLFWHQLPVTVGFFIFTHRKIKAKISLQRTPAQPHLSSLVTTAHFSCLFSYKCAEQSERNILQDNCFSSFVSELLFYCGFWLDSCIFWLWWLHYFSFTLVLAPYLCKIKCTFCWSLSQNRPLCSISSLCSNNVAYILIWVFYFCTKQNII